MNAYEDSVKVLTATIKSSTDIAQHVIQSGVVKIFSEWVDPDMPTPYVLLEKYAGGSDNDAQAEASDMLWKVTAIVEDDLSLASNLQKYIHEVLHNQIPDSSLLVGVGAYAPVLETSIYIDTYLRNRRAYHQRGGIYRVRLADITS